MAPAIGLRSAIAEIARFFLARQHLRTTAVSAYERQCVRLVSFRKTGVATVAEYNGTLGSWERLTEPRLFDLHTAATRSGLDPVCRICHLPAGVSPTMMAHHLRSAAHARRVAGIIERLREIPYPRFAREDPPS